MATLPPPQAGGRKLVFLHLPKTGGTTLHHHFSAHFAPEEICPERFSNLHDLPREQLDRYRYFCGHFNFDQVRLIPGPLFLVTVLRDPVERLMSSYLYWKRHTAEAVARPGMEGPALARSAPLAEFLRNPHHQVQDSVNNTMTRYLAGQVTVNGDLTYRYFAGGAALPVTELEVLHRALGNLLAIDVVGLTSNLHEVYARVALAYGMPRLPALARLNARTDAAPGLGPVVEEPPDAQARAEIERSVWLDRVVFRLARAHLRQSARPPMAAPAA
ncbi:sulfotransferase family 2 domain-containing protein [Roseomonas fluvialis]|uniref:Sulfotransferase family protein n=1 Tax=Roseomonas fluvialis TaxID=1750527 RepID=A0ABM7XXX4_9PROT|nr:sulfotransferase family 2 domain-containing protein [Roseomonas fluvialis]BDG70334.1 hypothetical protein Rmf_02630 [Roseomonas fluvialis]